MDHKLLIVLFNLEKGTPAMAANCLARWAHMLNQYEYTIECWRTTDHGNADHLPAGDDPLFDKEKEEGKGYMVLTIGMLDRQLDPDSDPLKPGVLAQESKKDPVISTVMRYVKKGW